jgi:Domain of unknown function (DUF1931)/BON domain
MATLDHVEVDALWPGMPVVVGGQTIGGLEDVIPQPDGRHVMRLIARREPDGRLIAIPIEWVRGVRDGSIELWVSRAELDRLPAYVPAIAASEARERVQRALDAHPETGTPGIQVTERDGTLELRGTVPDTATRATASRVARSVPGVGPVRNRLGTRAEPAIFAAGHGYPWLHTLLQRGTGLDFDEAQLARVEDLAERKLVDLFDVAEDTAIANGRGRVLDHDLPLTKGLQIVLLEVVDIAREFALEPLLVFLADAGIRTPIDEGLRPEVPRLMAALLILIGRLVQLLESTDENVSPARPSARALDRVAAILDLTL